MTEPAALMRLQELDLELLKHASTLSAMPQIPPASAVPALSGPQEADTEPLKEQCSIAPEPGRMFIASA